MDTFLDIAGVVGIIALGAVVIYVTMYFSSRFSGFDVASLTAVVGILLGGTAVGFLTKVTDQLDIRMVLLYPIGLAIGLGVWVKIKGPEAALSLRALRASSDRVGTLEPEDGTR